MVDIRLSKEKAQHAWPRNERAMPLSPEVGVIKRLTTSKSYNGAAEGKVEDTKVKILQFINTNRFSIRAVTEQSTFHAHFIRRRKVIFRIL